MTKLTHEQRKAIYHEKFFKHIQKNKKASDLTINTYIRRIFKIYELMYPDKVIPFRWTFLYRKPKEVIACIDKHIPNLNTKIGCYVAIFSCYEDNNAVKVADGGKVYYRRALDILIEERNQILDSQEMTEKEKKDWVLPHEMKNDRENYRKKMNRYASDCKRVQYFISCLYSLLPPRRAADYCDMSVNGKGNSFNTKDNKFVSFRFENYKTFKTYGIQTFDRKYMSELPNGEDILENLDWWARINESEWFLLKKMNPPALSGRVQTMSRNILGNNASVNDYRHQYVTYFLLSTKYLLEKRLVSEFMAHSTRMQEFYMRRIENKDDGIDKENSPEKLPEVAKE